MKNIKRVSKGGYVQADTTGTGSWEIGKITNFDTKHVWFQSAADMQIIKIRRDEAFKATAQDYAKAAQEAESTEIVEKAASKRDAAQEAESFHLHHRKDDNQAMAGLHRRATDNGNLDEEEEVLEDVEGMGEDEDGEEEESRSIVKKSYKKRYNKVKIDGRYTQNCGDLVSEQLLGKTLDEVYDITAETLEDDVDNLAARYEHLNPGQQRMVLGNKLRAFYKAQMKAEA